MRKCEKVIFENANIILLTDFHYTYLYLNDLFHKWQNMVPAASIQIYAIHHSASTACNVLNKRHYIALHPAPCIVNQNCCRDVASLSHYSDVIMGAIASKITSLTTVYSTVYSDADQRKHRSSVVTGLRAGNSPGPVDSPHKWPVTRKIFPFYNVIMQRRWSQMLTLSNDGKLPTDKVDLWYHGSLSLTQLSEIMAWLSNHTP